MVKRQKNVNVLSFYVCSLTRKIHIEKIIGKRKQVQDFNKLLGGQRPGELRGWL